MNVFLESTKRHLRYPFRGNISTEDLWDLSMTDLDKVYGVLKREEKDSKEETLLSTTRANTELELRLSVIKEVFDVRKMESEKRGRAKERREEREKLLTILENKENEALQNESVETIKKRLAELDSEE